MAYEIHSDPIPPTQRRRSKHDDMRDAIAKMESGQWFYATEKLKDDQARRIEQTRVAALVCRLGCGVRHVDGRVLVFKK